MTPQDPLHALLREWKSPEPEAEFDKKVVDAYRATVQHREDRPAVWWRFWNARISVPAPVLLAAIAAVVLLFWFRSTSVPSARRDAAGVVTRLNVTGFQPLPNGEARIVAIKETPQ